MPDQLFKVDEDKKKQAVVLLPGETNYALDAYSTTQDNNNNTSMIYSDDDDSLSDAYFFPRHNEGNSRDLSIKRNSLWDTDLAKNDDETVSVSGLARENTALLPPRRRPSSASSSRRMIPYDVLWGILFAFHILVLLACAIRFGKLLPIPSEPAMAINATTTTDATDAELPMIIIIHEPAVKDVIFLLGTSFRKVTMLSTGFAMFTSYLVFGFLVVLDIAMIYIMLGLSNLFGLASVILGLSLEPYGSAAIAGLALFGTTFAYTLHQWNRVEFTAVHLHTAVSALQPDMGLVSFVAMLVLFGMIMLWEWASWGVIDSLRIVQCESLEIRSCTVHLEAWHTPIFSALMFSLQWIIFVVLNTVRVVVAGLTATWWFAPQYVPSGACGTVITGRSVGRALLISFGSICLGSLVVGVSALWIDNLFSACCCCIGPPVPVKNGRTLPTSRSGTSIIIVMTEDKEISYGVWRASSRFCHGIQWYCSSWNKYAFCFVGMCEFAMIYRYSFPFAANHVTNPDGFGLTDSGSRVVRLFRSRQWLRLSKDSLLPYTLSWATIAVGFCTGLFAVLMEQTEGISILPVMVIFGIGLVVGSVIPAILFWGVIGSAVDTVLTCFAVSPTDLDKNHPVLGQSMKEAWNLWNIAQGVKNRA